MAAVDRDAAARATAAAPTPTRSEVPAAIPPPCAPPAAPAAAVPSSATPAPWVLRFDGACRQNPGPGGAGAALFGPGGAVVWTCSFFMPGSETNNSAEYTAMLLGVESALHHGATRLRIEGDSHLALSQVRVTFSCTNRRLRRLRNRVRAGLARLAWHQLAHIDRKANAHADRLANRALDRKRTLVECAAHSAQDLDACTTRPSTTTTSDAAPNAAETPPLPRAQRPSTSHPPDDDAADAEEDVAMRDGGEVFPVLRASDGAIPAKQPRLRLRALGDGEFDAASDALANMANALATKIDDAESWESAEGYITAIPERIRDALRPYSVVVPPVASSATRPPTARGPTLPPRSTAPPAAASARPSRSARRRERRARARPPRTTRHAREHRLDEALDDLDAVQHATPDDQRAIRNARRRVGRLRGAQAHADLRRDFARNERACVERILRAASPDATTSPSESAACPIDGAALHAHFTATNTPRTRFDFEDPAGQIFREALDALPRADAEADAFDEELTLDEIEDQLQRVTAGSSPGLDGLGYDILKKFAQPLLPLLHAAFARCWRSRRVPATWRVGLVRLLPKKGDPTLPTSWRPICLQLAIYKLYSGLMARRLSRWLEGNARLPIAQKGFRAFNGCHEHNFVAAALLDQTRRLHRQLYEVWYDLANAFGSLPQPLMWAVLARMGVDTAFIERCSGIYDDSYFVVGNAADGITAPVRQEVGVYQGCPLSPLLFIAATAPLLHALERLDGVGVTLADGVRPCATAYADDIKVFADSADGVRRCHAIVVAFLSWTGLRANPAKCALLAVKRNARGNPVRDDELQLRLHGEPIAHLTLGDAYTYLGVGDGFDHVRHRLQLAPKLAALKREAVALLRSGLAPHQILKALKVYVYPKVTYALPHVRPLRSQLEGFDNAIVRGVKHLLRLPTNATNAFIFAPVSGGGLGLLSLVEHHHALQVAHAWQMLHSRDPAVAAIARAQVRQAAAARNKLDAAHWCERDDELAHEFLNGTLGAHPHATPKRRNGDIGSLWVDVQRHLRVYDLKLSVRPPAAEPAAGGAAPPSGPLQLQVPHHRGWLDHRTVLREVRTHLRLRHLAKWRGLVDQGRTAREHGRAGSAFITRGTGLRDADYCFAFQARLNQLDTHSVLKRRRLRGNATCRHPQCTHAETTAHVLNHCVGNMDTIRQRHDDALAMIEKALAKPVERSRGTKRLLINMTVPGFDGLRLRPDIQVYDDTKREVVVADLAITHENQPMDAPSTSALRQSYELKLTKYDVVKRDLERRGWRVHMAPLIYGSLGAIASSNFAAYTERLGLLKRDARQLDQRVSVHAIQASRRIWNWHCSQHRMRQNSRTSGSGARGSGGTSQRADDQAAR